MARDVSTLTIELKANDQASPAIRKVDRSVGELSDGLSGPLVAGAAAAAAALTGMATLLRDSVGAAAESAAVIKELENALSDLGPTGAQVSKALVEQAGALQQVTQFSDDAIIKGQALAAAFVKNEATLREMTQAAVDFSAGRGIDLGTAFDLLTKASQGSTETLTRYGIVLKEGIPKGERFAEVLRIISERFGGRAIADANTYVGAVTKVGNAWEDVQKAIGRTVTESTAINQTLRDTAAVLNAMAAAAAESNDSHSAFVETVVRLGQQAQDASSPLAQLVSSIREIQESRAAAAALDSLVAASGRLAANAPGLRRLGDAVKAMNEEAARGVNPLEQWIFRMNEAEDSAKRFIQTSKDFGTGIDDAARPVLNFSQAIEDLKAKFDAGGITLRQYLDEYEALKTSFETGSAVAERAAAATDSHGKAHAEGAQAIRDGTAANREYAESLIGEVIPALERTGRTAASVAAAVSGVFDRAGNELPAGGTLSLGGTRYDLPGGGSRLVGAANGVRNPASNIGVNYQTGGGSAGAPFSGRYTIDTPQYGTIEAFKVASYGFGPSGAGVSTYGVLPGGRIVLLREQ